MTATIQKRFYTLAEAGTIFSLDPRSVRRYIADGRLQAVRIGGVIRIPIAEIERMASAQPIGQGRR